MRTPAAGGWNPVMVEGDKAGNGQKRLFEPVFTLGSVVLIFGFVLGGLSGFYALKQDTGAIATRLEERSRQTDFNFASLGKALANIQDLIDKNAPTRIGRPEVQQMLDKVDNRIDGHEVRLQSLEKRLR